MTDDPDLAMVQLGHEEVRADALAGTGTSLPAAIAGRPLASEPGLPELLDELPTDGWRVVDSGEHGRLLTLAAPHHELRGAWALAYLRKRSDRWHLSSTAMPEFPRPGKASRRRHLRLTWPQSPITAPAGCVPPLTVTLTNVSGELRRETMSDTHAAIAWIVDGKTGERLPAAGWFAYGDQNPVELPAGASTELVPVLATENADGLPPGEYGLEAVLLALDLPSDRGRLRLI
jgi:hypothetical protein